MDLDREEAARTGGKWVVPELMGGGTTGGHGVQVDVLSDNPVQILGRWENVDD